MYEITPTPAISVGAKSAEIKRNRAKKEKRENSEKELACQKRKDSMHSEMISLKKESIVSHDKNTNEIKQILDSIKSEIAKIELEVPELFDGDKIAQSLTDNSKKVEGLLKDLVNNVSKIKLEGKELDLSPYVKVISEVLIKNTTGLKKELDKLNQAVSEISFDIEQPIEWIFDVSRDSKGYIQSVNAKAYFGDEDDG